MLLAVSSISIHYVLAFIVLLNISKVYKAQLTWIDMGNVQTLRNLGKRPFPTPLIFPHTSSITPSSLSVTLFLLPQHNFLLFILSLSPPPSLPMFCVWKPNSYSVHYVLSPSFLLSHSSKIKHFPLPFFLSSNLSFTFYLNPSKQTAPWTIYPHMEALQRQSRSSHSS